MAIQTDIQNSQYGVPFIGAYFRIVNAVISRQRQEDIRHSVMIDIVGYATRPQNEDTREVEFRRYHCALDTIEAQSGDNFLSKCYTWTMQQPDMQGCIGV